MACTSTARSGLGHRRLAVLDLAGGAQPMTSADGQAIVTFNGEIFNYVALRRELLAAARPLRTRGDTEVLLAGHQRWGAAGLLARLRGMFAFALGPPPRDAVAGPRSPRHQAPLLRELRRRRAAVRVGAQGAAVLSGGRPRPRPRPASTLTSTSSTSRRRGRSSPGSASCRRATGCAGTRRQQVALVGPAAARPGSAAARARGLGRGGRAGAAPRRSRCTPSPTSRSAPSCPAASTRRRSSR
jgi:hypothetical protein